MNNTNKPTTLINSEDQARTDRVTRESVEVREKTRRALGSLNWDQQNLYQPPLTSPTEYPLLIENEERITEGEELKKAFIIFNEAKNNLEKAIEEKDLPSVITDSQENKKLVKIAKTVFLQKIKIVRALIKLDIAEKKQRLESLLENPGSSLSEIVSKENLKENIKQYIEKYEQWLDSITNEEIEEAELNREKRIKQLLIAAAILTVVLSIGLGVGLSK